MTTALTEIPWSPPRDSSDSINTTETTSPSPEYSNVIPGRPIRPLPKRRLKNRLSVEEAGAIVYPPAPASSSSFFGSPNSFTEESFRSKYVAGDLNERVQDASSYGGHGHYEPCTDCGGSHDHHSDHDSDEDEGTSQRRPSWSDSASFGQHQANLAALDSRGAHDSYESFENTNNKKKRKIPISSMSTSMADLDINSDRLAAENQALRTYASAGGVKHGAATSSGAGLSGPGRGRFARSARTGNERRPLDEASEQGIISAAIANASLKSPRSPIAGQENLPHGAEELDTAPSGKDFTFECKSSFSSTAGVAKLSPSVLPARDVAPGGRGAAPIPDKDNYAQRANSGSMPPTQAQPGQRNEPRRRPRRPGQEYILAEQQRRMQQQYNNYHHPPRKEDIWICEFCEYESIFGAAPLALVKQYEIKDRKERKRLEEKRRLLEKAKAKSRKKKGAKGVKATSQAAGAHADTSSVPYDPQYDGLDPQDIDSQAEDEFFEDGLEPPPPLATSHSDYGPPIPSTAPTISPGIESHSRNSAEPRPRH
ncbi:hypothetical protein MRB53_037624 [Persea americana]|nr:hypothetical protein MRB53_037624 [Persea americana]